VTEIFNWLILFAFSVAAIPAARWIVRRAHAGWTGPKTPLGFAFLYVMILAAIFGISFSAAAGIYGLILQQEDFLRLAGLLGVIKFLLAFSGLWYGAIYALKLRVDPEAPK